MLVAIAYSMGCKGSADEAPPAPVVLAPTDQRATDPLAKISDYEATAAKRDTEETKCRKPRTVYDGSIDVAANDYTHLVQRGDDYVSVPVENLDKVFSTSADVRFTLDYPFEKPFAGTVKGQLTRRNIIDAIRRGFRTMYEGTSVQDIPGMYNKDVRGPYGRSFHAIDDLVIRTRRPLRRQLVGHLNRKLVWREFKGDTDSLLREKHDDEKAPET